MIYINNPVGLDAIIQECQQYLTTELPSISLVYGRAFKNENRDGQTIPEVYLGSNEYLEVLTNDTVDSHIFFDVEDERNAVPVGNMNRYKIESVVRIIVCSKLSGYDHRATEELISSVLLAMDSFNSSFSSWKFDKILESTKKVLTNYNYALSEKKANMQPFYMVAFEYNVIYSINNSQC